MLSCVGSSPGCSPKIVPRVSCCVSVSTLIKRDQCLFIYGLFNDCLGSHVESSDGMNNG
jgi:hypothetical protein